MTHDEKCTFEVAKLAKEKEEHRYKRGDCPKELWENIIKIIGGGIINDKENV